MDSDRYDMLSGRYSNAKELAEKTARERARMLYDLKALIHSESAPEQAKRIDFDRARALLETAAAADAALQIAYERANTAAGELGRPRIGYHH